MREQAPDSGWLKALDSGCLEVHDSGWRLEALCRCKGEGGQALLEEGGRQDRLSSQLLGWKPGRSPGHVLVSVKELSMQEVFQIRCCFSTDNKMHSGQ